MNNLRDTGRYPIEGDQDCYYSEERRVYHLSRLEEVVDAAPEGKGPDPATIARWLEPDELGIWLSDRGEPLQTVRLRLTGYARAHVAERPLSHDQKIVDEGPDGIVLSLKVRTLRNGTKLIPSKSSGISYRSAPKGLNPSAQGIALGLRAHPNPSPERAL
jgi:hypothetical protein